MAKSTGYIKLDRRILSWEWYKDHNVKEVFLHLLLIANYEPDNYKGVDIERGQCVITLPMLSNDLDISVQQARTALSKLKSTGEITAKIYSKFQVITIVNYDKYQVRQQANQQEINRQITGKSTGYNNKRNIRNKEINNIYIHTHTHTHARGKYKNVFISDEDAQAFIDEFGETRFNASVELLSEYISDKPNFVSENHIVPLRGWVQDRLNEKARKKQRADGRNDKLQRAKAAGFDFDFEDIFEKP